jgi:predicted signal transduction protein with EAL and GGDEF domain
VPTPRRSGSCATSEIKSVCRFLSINEHCGSSKPYLHRLKIDTVKVDRSFVNRIGREGKGSEMVRAIVTLAHNLGMDVVAEGVETAEQLAALRTLGCDYAQGFYFSEAVPSGLADSFMTSQPWRYREQPILLDVPEPSTAH